MGSLIYGADSFEAKLKTVEKQRKKHEKVVVDENLRREMDDFIVNNENVSVKDFKKLRAIGNASLTTLEDIGGRYGVKNDDYQVKIKDEREIKLYRIANKLFTKYQYRAFFACKNDEEVAAMNSVKKVDTIRGHVSSILQKDRKMQDSNEIIQLQEQILSECRFDAVAYSLLDSYRIRGMRDKFNDLMIKMIEDDQQNYDYLYRGIDEINTSFVLEYLHFMKDVNGQHQKLILRKDQVKQIAEALLTKHQEVLNLRNAPYYSTEKGLYNETSVYQGVQSMVNVSNWLREYKHDDLNNRFIDRYFKDEFVISRLRADPWFKDFWNYLIQRPDFEKYREG
jgi:hypothetical protein